MRYAIRIFLLSFAVLLFTQQGETRQFSEMTSPQIVINLPSRTLSLFAGAEFVKEYPIAIGKPSTPTPLGDFYILNKEVDPDWYPPNGNAVVPSGPDNPLGYRWMGFLPLYGIHGTNAPWTIGMTVSNGCVRMKEPDVEELFEVVPYGTPVRVVYERARLRITDTGRVLLGIYPDVYGYEEISWEQVKRLLYLHGAAGFVTDDELTVLINSEPDRQVELGQFIKLRVNDKELVEKAILRQDTIYVPIWPIAAALKMDAEWDVNSGNIRRGNRNVKGIIKGDILYATADDAQLLFGGQKVWHQEENTLEFSIVSVLLNKQILTKDVQIIDGVLAVPALVLTNAIPQRSVWDAQKRMLTVNENIVPTTLINETPYIKITEIFDPFKTFVFWSETDKTIELTYPY